MLYTDFVTRMASLHYSPRKVSGPRAVSTQPCDRECFFSNFCILEILRVYASVYVYL